MSDETGSPAGSGAAADVVARLLRARVADGPTLWLPVDGRSMWPTIRPPAKVRLDGGGRPRRGEVWAFVGAGEAIVVHRCERRSGPGYVFRGDGLARSDPWVPAGHLIGRVVQVEDQRGQHRLGPVDRSCGIGRHLVMRTRNWVRGLMVGRTDGR
jgi:hypothetical protein